MIILYFIGMLLLGIYKKNTKSSNEYLYSSRKLTLPSFIATLVTTWYGGILAIGNEVYKNGVITWFSLCFFWYIAAIIYAFYFAPKIYTMKIQSIPSLFSKKLGKASGIVSSFIMILLSSPAPYIMIFCMILNHIYNTNFLLSIPISIIFSVLYTYNGGFKSIIRTDKIQFILMFSGFIIIIYNIASDYGGYHYITNNTPKEYLSITLTDIIYVLPWGVIALSTFIDPNILQRSYSAKNLNILQNGMLISVAFWFIFDCLTILTGIYAISICLTDNSNIYLSLADITLDPIYRNIFFIGLLSIVMSTIDSFSFTSGTTIGRDLIPNIIKHNKQISLIKYTQTGIIITSIMSVLLILFIGYNNFNYVIDFWYSFGSLAASTILIPFIFLLNKSEFKLGILIICIPGLIFIISYFILELWFSIYLGLFSSLAFCLIFRIKS